MSLHFSKNGEKKIFFSMDVDYVPGTEKAIPTLIDFSNDHKLETTFFITGKFAVNYPNEVKQIHTNQFDIGVHGWDHGLSCSPENFRKDNYEVQYRNIKSSLDAIYEVCGFIPFLNRNPDLWTNQHTFKVLHDLNFKIDSSIPSKRLIGRIRNLKYIFSPSYPFTLEKYSILEVPPSALFFPINLSALRYFGLSFMKKITLLYSIFNSNIIFYGHPGEYLNANEFYSSQEKVKRHVSNIGPHVYKLTLDYISFVRKIGYRSMKMSDLI
jgi:hypothetical protein